MGTWEEPMKRFRLLLAVAAVGALAAPAAAETVYEKDVQYALAEVPRHAGRFFELKKIDWPAVTRQFTEEAKGIKTDQEHLVLLLRLVARLQDGHATVLPREKTKDIKLPEAAVQQTGPGMFWCTIGDRVYVKNSFATAQAVGITPGMQVLKVDGMPVHEWIERRTAERSERSGFSTPTQALFMTLHWGLARPVGTQLRLELEDLQGKSLDKTVVCQRATTIPSGPAFFPPALKGDGDVRYGKLAGGYGYIHFRRCPATLPELTDKALADLGNVPGLILDFRANGGGGFDHQGFMGRFVPAGRTLAYAVRYESAGSTPYGGPMVVIVDGNTRSAGETASGQFKEDGRAYMIGESATAGMSSSKATVELPSGLFALYVSNASNKGRFNDGRGIEGVGVQPHEVVPYKAADLAAGVDTLIARAEALLKEFPQEKVPYRAEAFGWKP
jgi:C-terminal processing protease CtpA/Prc